MFDTITLDDGQPYLQDKLVTIKNFEGKSILSYKYIEGVNVYEKSIKLCLNTYYLTIDYDDSNYYSDNKWKILSSDDLYILISDENVYKTVVNGLPEYYLFEDSSKEDSMAMGETLEDFHILRNIFYE